MRELVASWYGVLNAIFRITSGPLQPLIDTRQASLPGILLLGLLGATSPCQLSTSASGLAYLSRGLPRRGRRLAVAYVAGKAVVYIVVGLLAMAVGQGLSVAAIPVVQVALLQRMQRADRILRPATAVVFLLAGLNDTLLYWFL